MNIPNNFTFYICGQDEIPRYKDEYITHIVSFTHNGNYNGDPDYGQFNFAPKILRLSVHDVFNPDVHPKELIWPDKKLMGEIIDFAEEIKRELDEGNEVRLLSQCAAGISRSTATAYVILCYLMGEWEERTALALIENKRPIARPNPLMVQIADELMGRNYKMVAPLKNKLYLKRDSDQDDSCLLF